MEWPYDFRLMQGPYSSQGRNFEELCALLLKAKHPSWRVVPREAPDWGVDFIVYAGKKTLACQCKFFLDAFGRTQQYQIESSLSKATAYKRKLRWTEYTVCLPRNLTAAQQQWLKRLERQQRIRISLLQASDLWALLSDFPYVRYAFFPAQTLNFSPGIELGTLIIGSVQSLQKKVAPLNPLYSPFLLPPPKRSILLCAAGDVMAALGDLPAAANLYSEAKGLAESNVEKAQVLERQAEVNLSLGEYATAERSLKAWYKVGDGSAKNRLDLIKAELLLFKREYGKARNLTLKAMKASARLGQKTSVARGDTNLGHLAYYQADWSDALRHYTKALSAWQRLGDPHKVAYLEGCVAAILRRRGHLHEALSLLEKSLHFFRLEKNAAAFAEACSDMGMILYEIGQWRLAEQYHRQALDLERQRNNPLGQGICYNNLGLVCRVRGKTQDAFDYHQKAIDIGRSLHDKQSLFYGYSYLGLTYLEIGSKPQAKNCFLKAQRAAKSAKFSLGIALSKLNLAQIALGRKPFNAAVAMAQSALSLLNKNAGTLAILAGKRVLADCLVTIGQARRARHILRNVIRTSGQAGAPYEKAQALMSLSRAEGVLENGTAAMEAAARASELLAILKN